MCAYPVRHLQRRGGYGLLVGRCSLLDELEHFVEKLHTILFEEDEVGGITDHHVPLDRRVHQCLDEAVAILLERPGVEIPPMTNVGT